MEKSLQDALDDWADDVLDASDNDVPFDKGDLMLSGDIERERLKVIIGYYEEYAAKQHEEHRTKKKYLEKNVYKDANKLEKIMSRKIELGFK